MKPIISHTFRGKRYLIKNARKGASFLGICDDPNWKGPKVVKIPMHGATLDELDTILHEASHACNWDLTEEAVNAFAQSTARLLWRLGWRNSNYPAK